MTSRHDIYLHTSILSGRTVKIAIIHTRPTPPWSARQLILALESLGATASYIRPDQILSEFGGLEKSSRVYHGSSPLDVSAVILRDIGFAITLEQFLRRFSAIKHLEILGTPVVNPVESLVLARNKHLSLLLLSSRGIPVPRTAVTEDPYTAYRIAQSWGTIVIKPIVGSMGFGALKLDDPDVAFVVARTLAQLGQPIYVQEYVEKPNRDIRAFVVGDRVVAAYYRVGDRSWKTNIAQGAKAVAIDRCPSEVEELAVRCCKILGLHYGGVDIAETENGYVVLEVNASPGWRGLVAATGINPATHIARYVIELARR